MTGIMCALIGAAGEAALYAFTNATFTPGTQIGRTGPSLAQAVAGLTGTGVDAWKNNTAFFNTSSGIQLWTVPSTGTYTIEAFGAQGGTVSGSFSGGLGARMLGNFSLAKGQVLRIIAGQAGTQSPAASGNKGGGGGTFVWIDGIVSNPLIVAGGGGGSQASANGVGAPTTESGTTKSDGSGTAGTSGNGTTNGAGFFTNGLTDGTPENGGIAPLSALNGATGGSGYSTIHEGGFGGGGGGGGSPSTTQAAGGGGGYSGGAGVGTPATVGGGGGGSYNSGTSQSNSSSVRSGNGQVIITKL